MKFKLDENLSPSLSAEFVAAGHDAHSVVEQQLGGETDRKVIDVCSTEHRVLVTLDLDFANILDYPPGQYAGIVVLRLANQAHSRVLRAIQRVIALLPYENVECALWIVEESRIRIYD